MVKHIIIAILIIAIIIMIGLYMNHKENYIFENKFKIYNSGGKLINKSKDDNVDTYDIRFKLYNINGKLIENKDWEYSEQETLKKYLKKTDNLLQLGGNIGASCIYADKLLDKKSKNICVEPNKLVLSTLHKNKKYNNCNFDIIEGVISNKKNLKLLNKGESASYNFWGSKVTKDGTEPIKSYRLTSIPEHKKINVLFADCEGCLEGFLDENENILDQLRLVIYEEDQQDICNYKKIQDLLKRKNFKSIENSRNRVWIKE